jgi:hypothetical protein
MLWVFSDKQRMLLCFTQESESITYKTTHEISKAYITEGKIGNMHKVN